MLKGLLDLVTRHIRNDIYGISDQNVVFVYLLLLARVPDEEELINGRRMDFARLLRRIAGSKEFQKVVLPAFCAATADHRVPSSAYFLETRDWLVGSNLLDDAESARRAPGWTALRRAAFADTGFRRLVEHHAAPLNCFPGRMAFQSGTSIVAHDAALPGRVIDEREADALNRLFLAEGAVTPGMERGEALRTALAAPTAPVVLAAVAAPIWGAARGQVQAVPSSREAEALARFFGSPSIAAARTWRATLRAAVETPTFWTAAHGVEGLAAALCRAAVGGGVRLRPDGLVAAPSGCTGPLEVEIYLASGEPLTRRLLPALSSDGDATLYPAPASPSFPESILVLVRPVGHETWTLLDMSEATAVPDVVSAPATPERLALGTVSCTAGHVEGVVGSGVPEEGTTIVLEYRAPGPDGGWVQAGTARIGADGTFSVPLPAPVLAHGSVELRLLHGDNRHGAPAWGDVLHLDRPTVETWLAAAGSPGREAMLLETIVLGGRVDLAVLALDWIETHEESVDAPGALFVLQLATFLHGADHDADPDRRRALIERLWCHTDQGRIFTPMRRTALAAMAAAGGRARLRFRTGEMAEAVVDVSILRGMNGDEASAADAADTMLALDRLPVARRILRTALADKPNSARLAAVEARLALRSGNVEAARSAALRAIKAQPGNGAAREALARCHAVEGRSLAAVQVITESHGLSRPLTIGAARLALSLGWRDAADAWAGQSTALADLAERRATTAPAPEQADFSVFLGSACSGVSELEMADLFEALGPSCRQFAPIEEDNMASLATLGAWTVILLEPAVLDLDLLARIMAQRWRHVCAIRMTAGGVHAARLAGLAVRSDLLGFFGPLSAAEFIDRAESRFKTQTVAVGR